MLCFHSITILTNLVFLSSTVCLCRSIEDAVTSQQTVLSPPQQLVGYETTKMATNRTGTAVAMGNYLSVPFGE